MKWPFAFLAVLAALAAWWWRMYSDQLTLARTIYGEARGEGWLGMQAVANVIMNRVNTDIGGDGVPDWWGEGVKGVCLASSQFSAWNDGDPNAALIRTKIPGQGDAVFDDAMVIAGLAVRGRLEDVTGGSTHYYNAALVSPSWSVSWDARQAIGNHVFGVA